MGIPAIRIRIAAQPYVFVPSSNEHPNQFSVGCTESMGQHYGRIPLIDVSIRGTCVHFFRQRSPTRTETTSSLHSIEQEFVAVCLLPFPLLKLGQAFHTRQRMRIVTG